jgi:hypothetical protein
MFAKNVVHSEKWIIIQQTSVTVSSVIDYSHAVDLGMALSMNPEKQENEKLI